MPKKKACARNIGRSERCGGPKAQDVSYSDKIGKNVVDCFSISCTSGSQEVCNQSGETCDMEAAILICK